MEKKGRENLDWPNLLSALSARATTSIGQRVCHDDDFAQTKSEVLSRYALIKEIWHCWDEQLRIPVGQVSDMTGPLQSTLLGKVLEISDLCVVRDGMSGLRELRRWSQAHLHIYPLLWEHCCQITISNPLCDRLLRSFGPDSDLCANEYPKLARLRQQKQELKSQISRELQRLIVDLSPKLQEQFFTERNGRFVLPVRANQKRGLGIVHGQSKTGETVFVEPFQVLPLTNGLKQVESAYHHEHARILTMLSRSIANCADALLEGLEQAGKLDRFCARAQLGKDIHGIVPTVGDSGFFVAQKVRHPLLCLSEQKVVSNDITIDNQRSVLLLSGPNAGGKTVTLKSIGMLSWMVRAGIPIPAAPGSRVDFFPQILSEIGDVQQLSSGLSTFSGHLIQIKEILSLAKPNSLILLDELGSGTDPAQGAALAQSIIESLLDNGSRVILTTHFLRLKALAAVHERFQMAAAQFMNGRPTYKLDWGQVGESHAISLAQNLGMPRDLVSRAKDLLQTQERQIGDLITELEELRSQTQRKLEEVEKSQIQIDYEKRNLVQLRTKLNQERSRLKEKKLDKFEQWISQQEGRIKRLIAALQSNPNLKNAGEKLAELREVKSQISPKVADDVSPVTQQIDLGDVVEHRQWGKGAKVVKVLTADSLVIDVDGLSVQVMRKDIVSVGKPTKSQSSVQTGSKRPKLSSKIVAVRTDGNTCNLRGLRVDESLQRLELFLDQMLLGSYDVVFVLHGHGTGALKKAVRGWLKTSRYVQKWRPANSNEGGDAFTVIQLS